MDVDGDGNQELIIILTDRVGESPPQFLPISLSSSYVSLLPRRESSPPSEQMGSSLPNYGLRCRSLQYHSPVIFPDYFWPSPCFRSAELVLSQMGASYYISLPLSGGDKVDLIHQMDNKSTSVMMLPERTVIAGIMGSMMDNLAIRGGSIIFFNNQLLPNDTL